MNGNNFIYVNFPKKKSNDIDALSKKVTNQINRDFDNMIYKECLKHEK